MSRSRLFGCAQFWCFEVPFYTRSSRILYSKISVQTCRRWKHTGSFSLCPANCASYEKNDLRQNDCQTQNDGHSSTSQTVTLSVQNDGHSDSSLSEQNGGRSLSEQNDGCSLSEQNGGHSDSSLSAQNGGRSLSDQNGGRSVSEQNDGRSLSEQNDGRDSSLSEQNDGRDSSQVEILTNESDPCAGLEFDIDGYVDNMVDERFPEHSAPLIKGKINTFLKTFYNRRQVEEEAKEHGLDRKLFVDTYKSFKRNIFEEANVDSDLYNVLYELQNGIGHVDDLLPFFLSYAKRLYPVLDCLDDLRDISDFRGPPDMYPEARNMKRKIIFHAGPTNSGKTHEALQRFQNAKSGIYCGPLRLLASEVYQRTNDNGVPCDLITGEERKWAVCEDEPSNHLACTVEVSSATREYECAVIDEIQMIAEPERGFAWTKALLGLLSPEIHLCGEPTAINLVQQLVTACGDKFEITYHKRLTSLEIENSSLNSDFSKIQRGDCIIAFSQRELYRIRRIVESATRWKCAIVYGGLPPATKVDQARRFNDPNDNCKVLIASDAVGMGLNLNIHRIVFSSMEKFDGQRMTCLTSSQVKQIAGRAGRFGTEYAEGLVTTLHKPDLPTLHHLMGESSENIKEAGVAPTIEQVEMFSYQLPKASLKEIFETFCGLCQVSGSYFICSLDKKKNIADIIESIPLTIRDRYTLCMSPADCRHPFTKVMLVRFARVISSGKVLSAEGLRRLLAGWPPSRPTSLRSMQELEVLHDSFDLYLWLSYRYPEIFVDRDEIRGMQNELQLLINHSLSSNMSLTGVLPTILNKQTSLSGVLPTTDNKQTSTFKDDQIVNRLVRKNARQNTREATDLQPDLRKVSWWDKSQVSRRHNTTLTARLLQDKILTRRQLKRLHQEWQENFVKDRK